MADGTNLDAILGGRVRLRQFHAGHRIGADAVLLAAAAGAPAGRVVDVGAGVGAVGLALLTRWPEARCDLVEIDAAQAALAEGNAELNGVLDRVRVIVADVADGAARREAGLVNGEADLVLTNPPFLEAGKARVSPDAARARAHVLAAGEGGDPLAAWIVACLALLAPGGRFQMIHRADALAGVLAAIGERLGGVGVRPVHPRADSAAIRVLVGGIKGSRAPLSLLPGLVLHEPSGEFTPLAGALHRGEATL
jgi:tRNA1(Val) A37 N6-methylase TrmN6